MLKHQSNPLQKIVRGAIRDLINQSNTKKASKAKNSKAKKLNKTKIQ